MQRLDLNTGVRLRFYSVRSNYWLCPICGGLHPDKGWRILILFLVIALIGFINIVFKPVSKPITSGIAGVIPQRRQSQLTAAQKLDRSNPLQLLETPSPGLQVPATAVIWNRTAAGSYLWERPGGQILMYVPNSAWVELQDRWFDNGPVPYGLAAVGVVVGWLDMRDVHRMPQPAEKTLKIRSSAGAFLYDQPWGSAGMWLAPGTPLLLVKPVGKDGWQAVKILVGGNSGWLPTSYLADW